MTPAMHTAFAAATQQDRVASGMTRARLFASLDPRPASGWPWPQFRRRPTLRLA
jgi:hypothetical protein